MRPVMSLSPRPLGRLSSIAAAALLALGAIGCEDDPGRPLGGTCLDDADCASGFCYVAVCLDPAGDEDGDGLDNRSEALVGSDPFDADTDGDGLLDAVEVGADPSAPTDTDGDGVPDVLESATFDSDGDCVFDQFDPVDDEDPAAAAVDEVCSRLGVCASGAGLSASCVSGPTPTDAVWTCRYDAVPGYDPDDRDCDGVDRDCDGVVDGGFVPTPTSCGPVDCLVTGELRCEGGVEVDTCDPTDTPDTCEPLACDAADHQPTETSCGEGACAAVGELVCDDGALVDTCAPAPAALVDATCDGVDDDCDGETDEDFVGTAVICGEGDCAAAGVTACVGGEIVDLCEPLPALSPCGDPCSPGLCVEGACEASPAPDYATCGDPLADAAGWCVAGECVPFVSLPLAPLGVDERTLTASAGLNSGALAAFSYVDGEGVDVVGVASFGSSSLEPTYPIAGFDGDTVGLSAGFVIAGDHMLTRLNVVWELQQGAGSLDQIFDLIDVDGGARARYGAVAYFVDGAGFHVVAGGQIGGSLLVAVCDADLCAGSPSCPWTCRFPTASGGQDKVVAVAFLGGVPIAAVARGAGSPTALELAFVNGHQLVIAPGASLPGQGRTVEAMHVTSGSSPRVVRVGRGGLIALGDLDAVTEIAIASATDQQSVDFTAVTEHAGRLVVVGHSGDGGRGFLATAPVAQAGEASAWRLEPLVEAANADRAFRLRGAAGAGARLWVFGDALEGGVWTRRAWRFAP